MMSSGTGEDEAEREGEDKMENVREDDNSKAERESGERGVNSVTLSRLIFTAGHIAQWQVVHLEGFVTRELKRKREMAAEGERRKTNGTPAASGGRVGRTPRRTPAGKNQVNPV